jgi:hypothetical protein
MVQEILSSVYVLHEKLFGASIIRSESALLLPEMSLLTQRAKSLNRYDFESIRQTLATETDHVEELLNVFYTLVKIVFVRFSKLLGIVFDF